MVVYWFLQNEEWHAYEANSPVALCGKTSIVYGRDPVADAVPFGEKVHKACLNAVAKAEKAEAVEEVSAQSVEEARPATAAEEKGVAAEEKRLKGRKTT